MGDNPRVAAMFARMLRFARVIIFDKRGTGMSDPVDVVPTLEQRMDDVRAVMDAAGSERAALFGNSEGTPMSLLFAATYPERVSALILSGGMARTTRAPDYPWAAIREAMREALNELTLPRWGEGDSVDYFSPSMADDPIQRAWWARLERQGASPGMARKLAEMFFEVDVRGVLPLVQAPTMMFHHTGDRVVKIEGARWRALQIKGARLVELPGNDHVGYGTAAT